MTDGTAWRKPAFALALAAPALLSFAVFYGWPMLELFRLSAYDTDFITWKFVGLGNYLDLAHDDSFKRSALNSLAYVALLVPGQVGGALVVSMLAYSLPKWWHGYARVFTYVPFLAAGVIISQVWRWVFSMRGPANWLIGLAGAAPVAWFGSSATGIPAVALVLVTSAMGSYVTVLLAALLSVDRSTVEAAQVDGASRWRIAVSVLLPQVWPTVAVCLTLAAISAPQVYETVSFLAPYEATGTMTYEIYTQAFRYSRHGDAAAMAVVLLAVTVALTLLKDRAARDA